jgi:hypothetical protein
MAEDFTPEAKQELPIIDLGQPRIDLAYRNKIRRQPLLKRLAHRFREVLVQREEASRCHLWRGLRGGLVKQVGVELAFEIDRLRDLLACQVGIERVDPFDAEVVIGQRRDGTGLVSRTDHVGRTAKLARQDA